MWSDLLRNIAINLKATGPAAVLCVYLLVFGAVAIFATGPAGSMAMAPLTLIGLLLISALGHRT